MTTGVVVTAGGSVVGMAGVTGSVTPGVEPGGTVGSSQSFRECRQQSLRQARNFTGMVTAMGLYDNAKKFWVVERGIFRAKKFLAT